MLGVIGGSGLYELAALRADFRAGASTPYGDAADRPVVGRLNASGSGPAANEVAFIARHGAEHALAPHEVNYRANIWALRDVGVTEIVAVNSVGSLRREWAAGTIVVPDQLIDYTWGRECTFQEPGAGPLHTDFTEPFDPALRVNLGSAAESATVAIEDGATYGCTQGPRFETAAEIKRMMRDGCDLVGMTAMPEAILAREAGIRYAAICSVGNLAAGLAGPGQHLDHEVIAAASATSLDSIEAVLGQLVLNFS